MKRIFTTIMAAAAVLSATVSCSQYDDTDLKNSIAALEERTASLEEFVESMNGDLAAVRDLASKSEEGITIDSLVEKENGGYKVYFSDGTVTDISNGVKGDDGEQGDKGDNSTVDGADGADSPKIVIIEENGTKYWGYVGEDGENKYFYTGEAKPENRIPVSSGAPEISINEKGNWEVNGVDLGPAVGSGNPGSLFKSVTEEEDAVIFVLSDGTEFSIPKNTSSGGLYVDFLDNTMVHPEDAVVFNYGEEKSFLAVGFNNSAVVIKPSGWKALIVDGYLVVTAPAETNTFAEKSGEVSATVSVSGMTATASISVTLPTGSEEPGEGGDEEIEIPADPDPYFTENVTMTSARLAFDAIDMSPNYKGSMYNILIDVNDFNGTGYHVFLNLASTLNAVSESANPTLPDGEYTFASESGTDKTILLDEHTYAQEGVNYMTTKIYAGKLTVSGETVSGEVTLAGGVTISFSTSNSIDLNGNRLPISTSTFAGSVAPSPFSGDVIANINCNSDYCSGTIYPSNWAAGPALRFEIPTEDAFATTSLTGTYTEFLPGLIEINPFGSWGLIGGYGTTYNSVESDGSAGQYASLVSGEIQITENSRSDQDGSYKINITITFNGKDVKGNDVKVTFENIDANFYVYDSPKYFF